jgi:phosphate transport system protein
MTQPLAHPHRALFDEEMRRIRSVILVLGERVDRAITRSVGALVDRDVEASNEVIRNDHEINELQQEVRNLCFTALLTQGPLARDLREILGFLHMSAELERMGDHCASIAKLGRNLADLPAISPHVDIARMGDYCAEQVRDMLAALVARDIQRAREVANRDDRIDRIYHRIFDELIQLMAENTSYIYPATSLTFVAHHLERIADRVTNLAEDLVWLETGQTEELG